MNYIITIKRYLILAIIFGFKIILMEKPVEGFYTVFYQ